MSEQAPAVSVVIPTRDRPAELARCIAGLARQTLPEGALEIIVVDDGSRRPEDVAAALARTPSARLVQQRAAGPGAARNAGVRAASAPIVCFIDDDCEPAPEWAATLAGALADGTAAAAGRTVTEVSAGQLAEASQTIHDHLMERALTVPPHTTFATSNNLACRADVLHTLPFDQRYPIAGEDRDWCLRLTRRGHMLVVEPRALAVHRPQLTLGGFWRQHVRYGRGARHFRRSHDGVRRLESPEFYISLVRRGFECGFVTGLLVVVAQIATAIGFVSEGLAALFAGPA